MSPEDLWVPYGICCGLSIVLALRGASAPTTSGLWRSSIGRVKNLVSQRANPNIWDAAYSWVFRHNTLCLQRPEEAAQVKAFWG